MHICFSESKHRFTGFRLLKTLFLLKSVSVRTVVSLETHPSSLTTDEFSVLLYRCGPLLLGVLFTTWHFTGSRIAHWQPRPSLTPFKNFLNLHFIILCVYIQRSENSLSEVSWPFFKDRISLCSCDWPGTHRDLPAFAFHALLFKT